MEKYKMLSLWNIRKNKGQYISFGIIIFLAAFVLNLGCMVSFNFSKSFSEKYQATNSCDVFAIVPDATYQESMLDDIKTMDGVKEVQAQEGYYFTGSTWREENENALPSLYLPMRDNCSMNQLRVIDQAEQLNDRSIFVSVFLKYDGCEIGDTITLKSGTYEENFVVAGFVEDMIFGTNCLALMGYYLPEDSYQTLAQHSDQLLPIQSIGVKTDSVSNKTLSDEINEYLIQEQSAPCLVSYYENCFSLRTVTAQICAKIFIAFSFLMLLVCIMVSNFHITNNIEEEYQNMGALKALGYTGHQMLLFVLSPYLILSLIVSILGAIASYTALPIMVDAFAAQTGFLWEQGFDLISLILTCVILTLIIGVASYLCAAKMKRLQPIVALRGGIQTHNFRKNYFSFEKSGNVNVTLALKNLVANGKQNILLLLVSMVVTLASIFGSVMYYNMSVQSKGFLYAIVETMPAATFTVNEGCDTAALLQEVRENDKVSRAFYFDSQSVIVEKENVKAFITEDYSELDNDFCYEGRNPLHDNEITLGNATANNLQVKIGDYVTVKNGDCEAKYLITGFIQSINESGNCVGFTKSGFLRIAKDFKESNLDVCLKDESSEATDAFIKELTNAHSNDMKSSVNGIDIVNNAMHQFSTIAGAFAIFIFIITIILVIAILYMVIKTVIIRKKVDFGIQKAVGYTTKQLKYQMALSFSPIVLLGAFLGGLISFFYLNTGIGFLFRVLGVMKLEFQIPLLMLFVTVVGIVLLAFFLAIALSGRIRKISAYSLIKE